MMRRNIALIPAAGIGARFGAGKPKQYVEINGKTVLQHTIEIFEQHPRIDLIAVILSPEDLVFQTALSEKVRVFRVGGASRAETVRNGVSVLLEQGLVEAQDNILVHDAARCCLPAEALTRLLDEASEMMKAVFWPYRWLIRSSAQTAVIILMKPLRAQDYGRRKRRSFFRRPCYTVLYRLMI